jgi:RNA polymerase sigma factor (sigma-70 family)
MHVKRDISRGVAPASQQFGAAPSIIPPDVTAIDCALRGIRGFPASRVSKHPRGTLAVAGRVRLVGRPCTSHWLAELPSGAAAAARQLPLFLRSRCHRSPIAGEDWPELMKDLDFCDDAALLHAEEMPAEAFAVFYRRHVRTVLSYFAGLGVDAADAADLTAETFAAALLSRTRYSPTRGNARAWLLGIAEHKRVDSARRWARRRVAQRRLGLEPVPLSGRDYEDFADLGNMPGPAVAALARLPRDQRAAVSARILEGGEYSTVARRLGVSEATARKRVSRGLSALRRRLTESER